MATWPETLPGPMNTITIAQGTCTVPRKTQSGRIEYRRFGEGAPDKTKCTFRLFNEDANTFESFFARQANLGINWFTAFWLPIMGYTHHKARILGAPYRKAKGTLYSDYDVTLLIQDAVFCPTQDMLWPGAGPGAVPPEPSIEGKVWGVGSISIPDDLYGVKVFGYPSTLEAAVLRQNGTVYVFNTGSSNISELSNLGGIADISTSDLGALYLTTFGSVGWVGLANHAISNVPSIGDGVSVYNPGPTSASSKGVGVVLREDGSLLAWGTPEWADTVNDTLSGINNPRYVKATRGYILIIDQNNMCYFLGTAVVTYGCCRLIFTHPNVLSGCPFGPYSQCTLCTKNFEWLFSENGDTPRPDLAGSASPIVVPAGLNPVDMIYARGCDVLSIHEDGRLAVCYKEGYQPPALFTQIGDSVRVSTAAGAFGWPTPSAVLGILKES